MNNVATLTKAAMFGWYSIYEEMDTICNGQNQTNGIYEWIFKIECMKVSNSLITDRDQIIGDCFDDDKEARYCYVMRYNGHLELQDSSGSWWKIGKGSIGKIEKGDEIK